MPCGSTGRPVIGAGTVVVAKVPPAWEVRVIPLVVLSSTQSSNSRVSSMAAKDPGGTR